MAICFPSRAPRQWWNCHLAENCWAILRCGCWSLNLFSCQLSNDSLAHFTNDWILCYAVLWTMRYSILRNDNCPLRLVYRYLRVSDNFNPGLSASLYNVSCFVIRGTRRSKSSLNIIGSILRKFLNERTSSTRNSSIRREKLPSSNLLNSQGRTHSGTAGLVSLPYCWCSDYDATVTASSATGSAFAPYWSVHPWWQAATQVMNTKYYPPFITTFIVYF